MDDSWPLQKGFDRFYGFLGGETNNWYPDLIEDNRFIDQEYGPEEGYHLSKDLADKAISIIRDPRRLRSADARGVSRCEAVSAVRRVDAL